MIRFLSPIAAPNGASKCIVLWSSLPRKPHRTPAVPDLNQGRTQQWNWENSMDSAYSHGTLLAALLAGSQPLVYNLPFSEIPYFSALACLSIYIGSHRSLNVRERESVSLEQSLLAPLIASGFLFGLYLIIKNFPQFRIQNLLDFQLGLIGTVSLAQFLEPGLRKLKFLSRLDFSPPVWLLHDSNNEPVTISGSQLIGGMISLPIVLFDIISGHQNFTLSNFLACCLAIEVLRGVGITSFKSASVLLLGLLAYDVFWVFFSKGVVGENVMVAVATSSNIEGPLRLLMPKLSANAQYPYSILGLGDVAIPGILAALLLRFDIFKHGSEDDDGEYSYAYESEAALPDDEFFKSRRYFLPVLGSYFIGLLLTFAANSITQLGQPALLYIVPCMLSTSLLLSISRKELKKLVNHISSGQ
eukprot:g2212.t1